jgi:hypothetical protein
MTSRRNIHRGEQEWQSIMQDFERSALSQEQYCLHHNLAVSTFCKWKKQLNSAASTACSSDFIEIQPEQLIACKPKTDLKARFELAINLSTRFQLNLKIV